MVLCHKKKNIHYVTVPQYGEYPLRRVFTKTLHHKRESFPYGAVFQEGEYLL